MQVEELHSLSEALDERERDIVYAHYGLGPFVETLRDIGVRLGVSVERVRQLEERALEKLRVAAALPARPPGSSPRASSSFPPPTDSPSGSGSSADVEALNLGSSGLSQRVRHPVSPPRAAGRITPPREVGMRAHTGSPSNVHVQELFRSVNDCIRGLARNWPRASLGERQLAELGAEVAQVRLRVESSTDDALERLPRGELAAVAVEALA
jgi:DNA-binding CsgD family transcriptional regulator